MNNRSARRTWLACAAGGAALLSSLLVVSPVAAGGLYFTDRGVRPMGRGGAFVAGADDLGAIFYNPAGIVHAKRQVLADIGLLFFHSRYTRKARVRQNDPNTGQPTGQTWDRVFPTSEGSAAVLPIPTLAVSYDFGVDDLAVAAGVWSPYAAAARYENRVEGQPNPGRYMMLNLDGSVLAVPGLYGAYRVTPDVSIGAGIQALVGRYRSQTVMSSCLPDRWLCAPESPDYDAYTQLDVGPLFAASANVGLMFDPHPNVRVGASYQLPFRVDSPATVQVRIPSAAVFQNAYQQGQDARVEMNFPWIARLGVEGRWPTFRGEVAYIYEAWKMHDKIVITPENIILRDVLTFPDEYRITPQTIHRNFKNSWSLRFGGETWVNVDSYKLDLRGGVMYEKGAIPSEYLSTLSIDLDKIVVGFGASIHITPTWRLDCLLARTFTSSVEVSTDEAQFEMLSPVRANKPPPALRDYVNAGKYDADATILGVGLAVDYM